MNKPKVKGFSIINHEIRIKLGLGTGEYIILDFIDTWNKKNNNSISYGEYYKNTGYDKDWINNFLILLKETNFIIWDRQKQRIDVSEKWKNEFNIDGKIDELWMIHPAGTKAKSKVRLPYVLKQIAFEDLKQKLINYVNDCKNKESFAKNLDTWLNPKDKHWEAVVINRKKEIKKEIRTTIKFKQ